jgi:hypothetical protein
MSRRLANEQCSERHLVMGEPVIPDETELAARLDVQRMTVERVTVRITGIDKPHDQLGRSGIPFGS